MLDVLRARHCARCACMQMGPSAPPSPRLLAERMTHRVSVANATNSIFSTGVIRDPIIVKKFEKEVTVASEATTDDRTARLVFTSPTPPLRHGHVDTTCSSVQLARTFTPLAGTAVASETMHDFTVNDFDGKGGEIGHRCFSFSFRPVHLFNFTAEGSWCAIVNVASRRDHSDRELEQSYKFYRDKGVIVVAHP
ncbi:unnamed protein product [Litomosoides sigmodontis]|uniref:Uncharacterized protein n=1 Tax=Litomosoides sigmodontis TaxID=42156 RepID=A0A3P6UKZ8_LITSI|nr:unnamed protein product [Litomosoides sigmodontis]